MRKESRYNLVALPCGKGGCKPIKVAELQKQMHENTEMLNSFLDVEELETYQNDVTDLKLQNLEDLLDSNSAGSSPTRSCRKRKEGETKEASSLTCKRRTKDRDVSNKRYHNAVICLRERRSKEIEVASTHLATLKRSFPDQSIGEVLRSNRNYKCMTDGAQRVMLDQEVYRGSRKRVSQNEVVLHVAIHLSQTPAFVSEEFLVLGSMALSDLRDVIYCVLDKNMRNVEKEYNKMREQRGIEQKPLFDGGSYFYIEGTFYQDGRYDSSKDLALPPLMYLKNLDANTSGSKDGNISTAADHQRQDITLASMENTTFKDLTIRLGNEFPSLYCHQKCCEHLIVFRDVRMHSCSVDPKYVDQYPFRLAAPGITLEQHRQCEVCSAKAANQVTYEDSRTPHSPFYWCNDCFNRMHYDCSGKLIYSDLRVFPYKHDYQATLLHIPK